MAVNVSRSMRAELEQGVCENTCMQLQPDWSINANPPTERLNWPTYARAAEHCCDLLITGVISPRETPPAGGMYKVREGTGYTP